MARTLTTTLKNAVEAATRRPALRVVAQDTIQHFSTYQAPATSDGYTDACVASDGSILRVRLSRSGNAFQQTFSWQRITDPTQASQWSTWNTFSGGSGNMFQDGFCAISNNSGVLHAFAQQGSGGTALWNWTSTDNGQSWSGPGTVCTPPSNALLKGLASAGNNDVFFIYDVSGGEHLGACFYNGSWSSIHDWTLGLLNYGSGLAVCYGTPAPAGLYVIAYSDGYTLKTCTYNPSTQTWANGVTIAPATTTAIGRISPRFFYDPSALNGVGLMSLVCIEADSGLITGSVYNYPRIRQTSDLSHWSNGWIAHDLPTQYGANLLKTTPPAGNAGSRYYLATLATVQSAPAFSVSNATQYLDVSSSVLRYTRQETAHTASKLDVWLDNNKGVYNALVAPAGQSGQPIGLNTSIILSEGYDTGTPPTTKEVVQVGVYHLSRIEFVRSPEENVLHLVGFDLSRRLDFESRFQLTYTNQTISWLIAEICARAGLFQLALPNTTQMSQTVPTFVLHAGQTYRSALNELCDTYGLAYFLDQSEVMQVRELSSSDASVWNYQPEIEVVSFGSDDLRANHIIVSGKPPVGGQLGALTTAESYDDAHAHIVGEERVLQHTDTKLTTTAQCSLKAGFLLAQEQRAEIAHTVTVPANPALQLLDPITLTDYAAPTGSGQYGNSRITAQAVHFDAQQAVYAHHLKLGGV
jgi:hypothetical protein